MPSVTHEEQAGTGILAGPVESRDLPGWFHEQQAEAWRKFESIPRPSRKDQAWRFSNVDLLDLAQFRVPGSLSDDDRKNVLKYSRGLAQSVARMSFSHGQLERGAVGS